MSTGATEKSLPISNNEIDSQWTLQAYRNRM